MAGTFTFATDAFLDFLDAGKEDGGTDANGTRFNLGEDQGRWERDYIVLYFHRITKGLVGFEPLVGTISTASGVVLGWTNGDDEIQAASGYAYECIAHTLRMEDTGFYREEIVWRWYSEWYRTDPDTNDKISDKGNKDLTK